MGKSLTLYLPVAPWKRSCRILCVIGGVWAHLEREPRAHGTSGDEAPNSPWEQPWEKADLGRPTAPGGALPLGHSKFFSILCLPSRQLVVLGK